MENLGAFKDPRKRQAHRHLRHPLGCAETNAYLLDFAAGNIVRIDAKTKNVTILPDPTPDSRPRRGRVDHEGRLWFAEYQGNAHSACSTQGERISEWKVPTPWSG